MTNNLRYLSFIHFFSVSFIRSFLWIQFTSIRLKISLTVITAYCILWYQYNNSITVIMFLSKIWKEKLPYILELYLWILLSKRYIQISVFQFWANHIISFNKNTPIKFSFRTSIQCSVIHVFIFLRQHWYVE